MFVLNTLLVTSISILIKNSTYNQLILWILRNWILLRSAFLSNVQTQLRPKTPEVVVCDVTL